ncbi:MAG: VCBS repeat-containing protein, partial [Myxococcota bacterium]
AASLGLRTYRTGIFPVVTDVDSDGDVEFVAGDGVWQWDREARQWTAERYVTMTTEAGHIAVADFGDFPGANAWPAETPEVAVITNGAARVQTLDGTTVFGPVTLPGLGAGGPPTIGDFDGDGRPEFASAGANAYTVFDLDCSDVPIGACASGTTDGLLWSQRSQDASSNVTGSSIFDFEGDGRAEAVYGDECFIRVYDGETGDVLFSQARSSCTWNENPVIADLDGDFNAEIVIGDNYNCGSADSGRNCSGFGLGPRQTDPLFPGIRCSDNENCLSGSCDEGFCRCTMDTECCAGIGCDRAAFVCEAPPAGTPGTGNTCQASRPVGTLGIRVYRDAADRWVRSRPIWNQHAYYVTNVGDDGEIPRTSEAALNWRDDGLNNFRQNVQGDAVPGASPDITSRADALNCGPGGAEINAVVCNRGTDDVGFGVAVGFYVGDPDDGGTAICEVRTSTNLAPGECEPVTCPWADAPTESPGVDVWVVADDGEETFECREANNLTIYEDIFCGVLL